MQASLFTFFLKSFTEDMTLPMTFIDRWTIWHVVIVVVAALLAIFSRKKYEDEEKETDGLERA